LVEGIFDELTCKPKLTIKEAGGLEYIELQTIIDNDDSQNSKLTLQISKSLRLPCDAPDMTRQTLLNYIWGYQNGIWMPQYDTIGYGGNYIRFKDTSHAEHYGDLALVTISDSGYDPILTWSQGMVVKKDFSVGGYVGANQGLIGLGSGMTAQFDPSGIWLTHSGFPALHDIDHLANPPINPQICQYYIKNSDNHLYQCIKTSPIVWEDRRHISNYNYYLDTCYIRKAGYSIILYPEHRDSLPDSPSYGTCYYKNSDGHIYRWNGSSWGDMGSYVPNMPIQPYDLGHIACNEVNAFKIQFGNDTNLFRNAADVLKTDDNLIVSQNLWCDALVVDNNAGITGALSDSSISSSGVIHGCGGSGDAF